jgi:hypothetical protein
VSCVCVCVCVCVRVRVRWCVCACVCATMSSSWLHCGLNERRWGWDEAGKHHNIRLSNDGLSAKCHLSTYCPVRGSRGTTSLTLEKLQAMKNKKKLSFVSRVRDGDQGSIRACTTLRCTSTRSRPPPIRPLVSPMSTRLARRFGSAVPLTSWLVSCARSGIDTSRSYLSGWTAKDRGIGWYNDGNVYVRY